MDVTDIYQCTFLSPIDSKWQLTQELHFRTRFGEVVVPAGFVTDLFSAVPNTRYPDFWKASILHDWLYHLIRENNPNRPCKHKRHADVVFYDEMLIQSAVIFGKLQDYVGTEMAVDEFRKLLRRSWAYYKGVAGVVGRIYQFFAG
jgi:hypothetical protein